MPTLFLTDADLAGIADWRNAFAALKRAYGAPIDPLSVPVRSMARVPGTWLRTLSAISPLHGYLGCKLIAASPRQRRASYLVALFHPETMELAALFDGNRLTGLRTAATAVVAVDALAPAGSLRVAVLGSGIEARAQLEALAALRTIERATVYSPTEANRQRFAAELGSKLTVPIAVFDSPRNAIADVDVVLCAARARGEIPILYGQWLESGMTIVSVGSTLPEQREVDVGVIERAHSIVADMPQEVEHDTGDMQAAAKTGSDVHTKMMALADLVSGRRTARTSPRDIVLYKSVGSALQDVVIAEMLFLEARQRNIGTPLPVSIVPVAK